MDNYNIDEQIVTMRKQGLLLKEISKELNITYDKVRYILQKKQLNQIEYTNKCDNCMKEYKTTASHSKFCSESCRGKYNKNNSGDIARECKGCKGTFNVYSDSGKVYCSDECRMKFKEDRYRGELANRTITVYRYNCAGCEERKLSTRRGRTYCNESCRWKHYYLTTVVPRMKARRIKKRLECAECGKQFSSYRKVLCCSVKCTNRRSNRLESIRRRERLRKNGRIDWDISIEKLMKKYNGICYICNGHCDMDDYITLPNGTIVTGGRYPSVEHVHPVSKGGTHTWDNVELAHRSCNEAKGIKILDDIEFKLLR